ncbi:two-component system regulatory protein YycI [Lederbergia lenta]|uniref:YycI protein n=1 Tax=Lederbergia lenta TaxID=1467 RepID=A0A2X4WZ64_LEDLE|nr:two-component system regulatory protein YycI [Lederbergia lenta]MCM3112804.1 two-component system regulatory protein YycI [Lederbergia lenta]MEC2326229.1 two-component system regulatory protein YycI [Lederbergia lenta]SQI63722.1 YycI protein [Lederbergia lenta]
MDWSRIKSIFIIAFLILDLFLFSQLLTKHQTNQLEVKGDVSLKENMKDDGIVYDDLPMEIVSDQYMSANTKVFSEDDIEDSKHQVITLEGNTLIRAELKKPIKLTEKADLSELNAFIKANVLEGSQYDFWNYDKEVGTITYYQTFHNKFMFLNRSAYLTFYVNESNEVYAYDQTMLETIEPINEQEEVLTAFRALEALYLKGALNPNSEIISAKLGYYTLVSMEATQVLTPTWHFVVEHEGEQENMLVNAFDGQVIQMNTSPDKNILE